MKQRFSDFIVREVGLDGKCSSLDNLSGTELENLHFNKNKASSEIENISNEQLVDNVINEMTAITGGKFGGPVVASTESNELDPVEEQLKNFLFSCIDKSEDCPAKFTACACPDKQSRTKLHQMVRKYLSSYIESEMIEIGGEKFIDLLAKHKIEKGKGFFRNNNRWPDNLGDYLQFTIFKENIDTMNATQVISKMLFSKVDSIHFAGTKDRRAVTSQKFTMFRRKPSELTRLNTFNLPPYIRVGDFEYVKDPLKLGGLAGNNFSLIMRDLDASSEKVESACAAMRCSGFINYYGLQRFGSGGTKSHLSGLALFKQDWKSAVEFLFTPREGDKPEVAEGKVAFNAKDYTKALQILPFRMHAERLVVESLLRSPQDYCGAYSKISKSQWLMCIHAYQSYIWNMSVSERVRKYGLVCIEGDLVSVGSPLSSEMIFEDYEGGDGLNTHDYKMNNEEKDKKEEKVNSESSSIDKKIINEVHILTSEDIISNKYSIRDVVMPLPGHSIILPTNDIAIYYENLLSIDGLSLKFFSSCYPQHRMNGAYRNILEIPSDFQWNFFEYSDPNEELIPTEASYLRRAQNDKSVKKSDSSKFIVPRDYSVNAVPYVLTDITPSQYAEVPGKYGPGDGSDDQLIDKKENKCDDQDLVVNEKSSVSKNNVKLQGVQLKFTLPPGTYATMLIREITKQSTHSQFQKELTSLSTASFLASTANSTSIENKNENKTENNTENKSENKIENHSDSNDGKMNEKCKEISEGPLKKSRIV